MNKSRKQQDHGFTLLELMVGIGLFAIALFGTMMVLSQSLTLGKFSGSRGIAMNDTRRIFEEIRRVADANGLATVANTNWTTWGAQNLSNSLPGETVAVTDQQGNALPNNADPLPVRATLSWTEKGKATTYTVDTLVTKR